MELNEHTTSTIESQPIEDDLTLSPSTPFARSQVMFFERLKPQSQAAGVSGAGGGPFPNHFRTGAMSASSREGSTHARRSSACETTHAAAGEPQ